MNTTDKSIIKEEFSELLRYLKAVRDESMDKPKERKQLDEIIYIVRAAREEFVNMKFKAFKSGHSTTKGK